MKPDNHAQSSAQKYGGSWKDYIDIHEYMDDSRRGMSDMRHRAITHHTWFVYGPLTDKFGQVRENSDGKLYSVAQIGEDHCREDLGGHFPTLQDWCISIIPEPWMCGDLVTGSAPQSDKIPHRPEVTSSQSVSGQMFDEENIDNIRFDGVGNILRKK